MKTGIELWAGNELSYQQFVESMYKAESNAEFKASASYQSEIQDRLVHVDNGVAVIHVAGNLIDGSAGFAIFFGVLGYNDLRHALATAVADADTSVILLNIASGGGAVDGCHETAQLIARVNKIKPVVAYTGSNMQSAALWLGSQAQYIVAGQTAAVGSLGIVMVHVDRSEQLAKDGIKATVIRAGTDKALSTPYEPLSEKAKGIKQAEAESLYTIFLDQVALGRGVASKVADEKFGQGKVFLGKDAKAVGLVDAVGTYEDAMLKAQSLIKKRPASVAPRMKFGATNSTGVQAQASTTPIILADNLDNPQGTSMANKQSLSAEQLTAMAAGVTLEQAPAELTAEQTAAAAAASAAATAEAEAAALAAAEGLVSIAPVAKDPSSVEAVTVLQGMLASVNLELATSKVSEQVSAAALSAAQSNNSAFVEIARSSVRTMGLHFGVTAEAASAMSAEQVLTEHKRLATMFTAKFKVGGVAASSLTKPEADANAVPTMTLREQQIALKLPR